MNPPVDPKTFGLHPATKLERSEAGHFSILINRKSRIIMKDGKKIIGKILKIKKVVPDAQVNLKTSAPVCSKTREFLESHGVHIKAL